MTAPRARQGEATKEVGNQPAAAGTHQVGEPPAQAGEPAVPAGKPAAPAGELPTQGGATKEVGKPPAPAGGPPTGTNLGSWNLRMRDLVDSILQLGLEKSRKCRQYDFLSKANNRWGWCASWLVELRIHDLLTAEPAL